MRWIREKFRTLREKIVSEQKSATFIARGWALGVFVGSVIPFGVQIYVGDAAEVHLVRAEASFRALCPCVGLGRSSELSARRS